MLTSVLLYNGHYTYLSACNPLNSTTNSLNKYLTSATSPTFAHQLLRNSSV